MKSIALAEPLGEEIEQLRADVRAFLAAQVPRFSAEVRAAGWMSYDRAFSQSLGERGWIGMTWPRAYGGHERSSLERYVVLEELLAAGAPSGSHWVADRQSGPLILRHGTEEMKRSILQRIARGELTFCIGMSEPNVGSDLASVQARAERVDGGWKLTGTKVWTTFAHRSDYMIGLFRTSKDASDKHKGLSQFVIDLRTPGIEIRTIREVGGNDAFNEVNFAGAVIPQDALLGAEGAGWSQVVSELGFERSGPERYLSSMRLLIEAVDAADTSDTRATTELGIMYAELVTLREMSLGVATMLGKGEDVGIAAAIVKDLGVTFEQRIPHAVHDLFGRELLGEDDFTRVQAVTTEMAPGFSLRGGTREILRSLIGRELLR